MTTTLATPDKPACVDCGAPLPEPRPTSPSVRRCEHDWYIEQRRLHEAGEDVHPYAVAVLGRKK